MIPLARAFVFFALLAGLDAFGQTQSPAPAGSPPEPASPAPHKVKPLTPSPLDGALQDLQNLILKQSTEIAALTQEVRELREKIETRETPSTGGAAAEPPAPAPAATPPAAGTPAPAAPSEPEIPRAEATGGGIKHIVAKGETLTSIAKHYNIPLADLEKANKNLNERKMQIGQVLSIPGSPNPESPTSPEKKETP